MIGAIYITTEYGKASDYVRRYEDKDLTIIKADSGAFAVVPRIYAEARGLETLDL